MSDMHSLFLSPTNVRPTYRVEGVRGDSDIFILPVGLGPSFALGLFFGRPFFCLAAGLFFALDGFADLFAKRAIICPAFR